MNRTYHNPVYNANFPDPFVLKYCGEYWAYGTGEWHDGRWFGVLRSRDLVDWEDVGGALEPVPGEWPCRWAPEVSYLNGSFYLYYSIGDEETMQLRVAVARHPAGPFIDSGRRLSHEPFAIDAHVFVDDNGARHLFYASDYLAHSHVGTGTTRVALADPLTLQGEPAPVTRARYDWQVYHPNRPEKGGARWHTIEGPFVLKHKGRYYQMFSGGNWHNPTYGVSYATAERVDRPGEWDQHADGERLLPILRTIPGAVIGPGHNSVVRGPDNRQLYCVYHRWSADGSAREMAIDPLDWAGERMLLIGPSTTPRPLTLPTLSDLFDGTHASLGSAWEQIAGSWQVRDGAASGSGSVLARCRHPARHYLAELSLRALDASALGGYGVMVGDGLRLLIEPAHSRATLAVREGDSWRELPAALPTGFDPLAFQLLCVEVNAGVVTLRLDGTALRWSVALAGQADSPLALCCAGVPAAFAGFALTEGWLDLFDDEAAGGPPAGWRGEPGWQVRGGELRAPASEALVWLSKGPLPAAYELTVNVALDPGAGLAIAPASRDEERGPELHLVQLDGGWVLEYHRGEQIDRLGLPAGFDPAEPQQLRLRVAAGHLSVAWESVELGELPVTPHFNRLAIGGHGAARFEMLRVTALSAA
jgi:GH43 family beta-xylosidase